APEDIGGLFMAPRWLRDLGQTSWLAVGVTLLVVALIWILALTHAIVAPLIAATVVAAGASPVVRWLRAHHVGRGLGAALVLIGIVVLAFGVVLVVLNGITREIGSSSAELAKAKDTIAGWLSDLGAGDKTATDAVSDTSSAANAAIPALLK